MNWFDDLHVTKNQEKTSLLDFQLKGKGFSRIPFKTLPKIMTLKGGMALQLFEEAKNKGASKSKVPVVFDCLPT